ncbi:MAG: ferritin-like domain-containing protein [Chloroflexi bacterium]|nr:ferritin-like domain-containing protein [Chloroflexota bacterium]MBV9602038.1 ferritin-like domain-containing protein [Chloroflexota bacterium]
MANQFALDVSSIRQRARQHMEEGPVTPDNKTDPNEVIRVLQDVVATEIVCWMRYQQHAFSAKGVNHKPVAAEFAEHAQSELEHAVAAAQRITQLGGSPDMSPEHLAERSHTEYRTFEGTDLVGMLEENLVAERIVIQSYQEIIRWLGDRDPTTRRLLERILGEEEQHADDLSGLLGDRAKADSGGPTSPTS